MSSPTREATRLWITYAWVDNEEGDFEYLVDRLSLAGIDARYDRIALVPGRRLWDQIADHILDPETAGWAWLVTPASLASEACIEELNYAIGRALDERGSFPLIGLLHQVRANDTPPAIRSRLCVPLEDPTWPEQVLAGVQGRAPSRAPHQRLPFTIGFHTPFRGDASRAAIEVRPRLEHVDFWRIAVPPGHEVVFHGQGASGGHGPDAKQQMTISGTVSIDGEEWCLVGTRGPLGPTMSGYAVVSGPPWPNRIFFGAARGDEINGLVIALGVAEPEGRTGTAPFEHRRQPRHT